MLIIVKKGDKMIKLLELFGGIGAPRKALENLGIDIKSLDYVEIDEKAVRSYNALFKNIAKPSSVIGWNFKPDILVHGSPCQDFSRAGKRLGGNDEDKTRSSLMFETLKIIENMGMWKPKIVIWENVKGVLDKDMIHSFRKYLTYMEKLGYVSNYEVLNAINFGIPQRRERIYTISILNGESFNFSNLKTTKANSLKDYLEENVDDKYTITSKSMLDRIDKNNKKYSGYLKEINDFCYTITTKQNRCPNSGIINIGNGKYRLLTERECWRLMGFDDSDFEKVLEEFPNKIGKQNGTLYKQAGNSIVVNVLEAIFEELIIMGYIKEEL